MIKREPPFILFRLEYIRRPPDLGHDVNCVRWFTRFDAAIEHRAELHAKPDAEVVSLYAYRRIIEPVGDDHKPE